MTRDSLAFALSGTLFGLLVGWIIGSQQAPKPPAPAPAAPAAAEAPASPGTTQAPAAPTPLDTQRAADLEQQANASPSDPSVREQLGNMYFDAERYQDAAKWYEAALKLDPKNVNVSTDLALSYYSLNQTDRALQQIDHSLQIDPKHLKTLLNQGIIRAFGKQDLQGAIESWQKVVAIDPNSPEGKQAAQGLEGIRAATSGGAMPGAAGGASGGPAAGGAGGSPGAASGAPR